MPTLLQISDHAFAGNTWAPCGRSSAYGIDRNHVSATVINHTHPTIFHLLAEKARKITPKVDRLRGLVTAVVTPFLWSKQTGHWKSSLRQNAVNSKGEPTVWYTYPAIDLLRSVDLSAANVLEVGAGNSTLWWARHAKKVTSLESDPEWYASLNKKIPANVELHLVPFKFGDSIGICGENAPYDVIVIDGLQRAEFAIGTQPLLSKNGAIIVDNSDEGWGYEEGEYPIIDYFNSIGFQRIDLYGYAPNGSLPVCTSLFFDATCFLFSLNPPPKSFKAPQTHS
jgi:hypothetical protein